MKLRKSFIVFGFALTILSGCARESAEQEGTSKPANTEAPWQKYPSSPPTSPDPSLSKDKEVPVLSTMACSCRGPSTISCSGQGQEMGETECREGYQCLEVANAENAPSEEIALHCIDEKRNMNCYCLVPLPE